jgi:hypothetical protein
MDSWMQFESGEAEYLARIRGEAEQQRPQRVPRPLARPSRTVRAALATALVALSARIAPPVRETPLVSAA